MPLVIQIAFLLTRPWKLASHSHQFCAWFCLFVVWGIWFGFFFFCSFVSFWVFVVFHSLLGFFFVLFLVLVLFGIVLLVIWEEIVGFFFLFLSSVIFFVLRKPVPWKGHIDILKGAGWHAGASSLPRAFKSFDLQFSIFGLFLEHLFPKYWHSMA